MTLKLTNWTQRSKQTIKAGVMASFLVLSACSTNPATGERQFTALMPASSEAQIGAEEHAKVEQTYGKFMTGPIASYVSNVGQKVAKNTERSDVQYKFYVIDSVMVNAFALPGGYIYVSRGLLTLANSEAELAGVLGHEIGHVTARHAAERTSQGAIVGLGAAVLGAATGSSGVAQAANLGSNLYISSYSRGQESQADELGVRYLSRAAYDPRAMTTFLSSLDAQSKLEAREAGKSGNEFSYLSTHPLTAERVQQASVEATKYQPNNNENRATYLSMINGMTYGDSAAQGFARGNNFYHTQLGFTFSVPQGSTITNGTSQVAANHPNGTVILFDTDKVNGTPDPLTYLKQAWLKNENAANAESITINGMRAATASFSGTVQNKAVTVRLVAIEWKPGEFFRFSMAIPKGVSSAFMNELKSMTYSFRRLSDSEKQAIQPKKIYVLQAPAGAIVATLAGKMDVDGNKTEHFLVLNGMTSNDRVVTGQPYKIVVD